MPQKIDGIGYPYISPSDFTEHGIDYDNAKQISYESFSELSRKILPERDDIIFPRYGTIGKIRKIDTNRKILVSYSCCVIKPISKFVLVEYLYLVLLSPFIKKEIDRYTNKTTQPNVGLESIKSFLFPLPPIEEQKRIVYKLKELEPLIEKFNQAEIRLYELNSNIKEQLKKSILQYAIEGKLVPQDPNDEPASVLLERIRNEKEKLIAEGKVKKDNNESIIYRRDNSYYEKLNSKDLCIDDIIPFDIPYNWMWTRLSNIANTLGGYAFKSTEYTKAGVRVIRISDFDNGGILDDEYKYYQEEETFNKYLLKENDILLCMTGGTVGKVCVNKRKSKQYLNQRVAAIRTSDFIYYRYIYKVITSNYIQSIINKSKTSTNDNISMDTINDFLIPLPPFNEQVRICEAIDKV